MNYKVLARKWRPQRFSDVVGQQHIIEIITHSFLLKKIHHAYIFIGMRGTGKTTIARLFAKGLNCEKGITSVICRKCKNCKDIESGCFIDLIEIDAASRTKVEETREFLENVQYMPSIGRFKVYLIDEVHMLSKYSFNALLKILEEPPTHVKFILITTEYKKIPDTVLSRCLQFYLKPLSTAQITAQLIYIFNIENIFAEELAVESLAHAAKGSMRDALNLAEQAIILGKNKITTNIVSNMFGIVNIEYPLCLIENLVDGNIHEILHQIDNYSVLGINWDLLLSEMLIILKKIAIGQFLSSTVIINKNDDQVQNIEKRIYKLSHCITPENVQLYYQILLLGRRELPYSPNHRIGVEIVMLRALAFSPISETIMKNNHKNEEDMFSTINKNVNYDILQDSNKKNKICQTPENNQHTQKSNSPPDHLLRLKSKKNNNQYYVKNVKSDSFISSSVESEVTSDITKKLIKARLTLSKYKESNKLNKIKSTPDLVAMSCKKITTNILKRFSNINVNNVKKTIDDITKINKNYDVNLPDSSNIKKLNNNINKNQHKIIPIFMKEILHQVKKIDPWMFQIGHLFLPKLAKKIVMHSWKEDITSNKICLHMRSNYFHLNSVELKDIIQKSISKYTGNSITLYFKKDDNFAVKTPMEHIYILYKEKILKITTEFSNDPYIKKIKEFFDAEFNEDDLKILK